MASKKIDRTHCASHLPPVQYVHANWYLSYYSETGSIVLPQLKKQTLDPDTASLYRPISNLSYLSKIIERLVARRFTVHISDSQLLPAQQSAYRAFHSTETAVLSVHSDLVRAIDIGQVS